MTDVTTTTIDPSQSTLSASFAPYVNQMLTQGWQAAQQPFTPYSGTRYAETQPLLKDAFSGIQGLATPQSYTDQGIAQKYMDPYAQNVINIQQREAQRQADIAGTQRGAKFAQAGAFGGSRQAIENAEANRNLQMQLGDIQTKGLQSAYQQGREQFNTEQQRQAAGLQNLLTAGQVQQQLAQKPLDFGYEQWQESLKYPYQQATFMQSLLSGMPLKAPEYDAGGSDLQNILGGGIGTIALLKAILGQK